MVFRSNPASGVPVYLQLIEQVKHAIDVGALRPGEQLPAIRRVAEDLVINPNTVAEAQTPAGARWPPAARAGPP